MPDKRSRLRFDATKREDEPMTIVANTTPATALDRLLAWCADAWNSASEAEMLAAMDPKTLDGLASDCGVSPDQLLRLAKAGPHAADEMAEMMRALNIDFTEVQAREPGLFRQMQSSCANCAAKGRCKSDLAAGTAAVDFIEYCRNADLLTEMRATPEFLRD